MTDLASLIARYDGRAPRYTSYPTAPHFSGAIGPSAYMDWLAALPEGLDLSLYLHVPFCDRLCFYCGCNTSVVRLESSHRAYAKRLIQEIERTAAAIGRRLPARHIHWGGGTPTSLPGDRLNAIMSQIRHLFSVDPDAEVAIELDPTSVPEEGWKALRTMGVTRIRSACRTSSPPCKRRSGESNPTSRPPIARRRRGRSASIPSIST